MTLKITACGSEFCCNEEFYQKLEAAVTTADFPVTLERARGCIYACWGPRINVETPDGCLHRYGREEVRRNNLYIKPIGDDPVQTIVLDNKPKANL